LSLHRKEPGRKKRKRFFSFPSFLSLATEKNEQKGVSFVFFVLFVFFAAIGGKIAHLVGHPRHQFANNLMAKPPTQMITIAIATNLPIYQLTSLPRLMAERTSWRQKLPPIKRNRRRKQSPLPPPVEQTS
jgi:hypothetical protein